MQHEQSNRNCVAYYRRPVMLAAFDLTIRVTLSSRCALTVMADTHESLKWGETWQEVQPPPPPPSLPPCAPLLHSLSLTVSPLFSPSLSPFRIWFHFICSPAVKKAQRWWPWRDESSPCFSFMPSPSLPLSLTPSLLSLHLHSLHPRSPPLPPIVFSGRTEGWD